MNYLCKQIVNDDGEEIEKDNQFWHLTSVMSGDNCMLCTGEFLDDAAASGNGEEYIFKTVKRGGITCPVCMRILLEMKAVKL